MNQIYCNPTGYMWVNETQLLDRKPEIIKDNDYICQVVSDHLGISVEQMKTKTRKREIFTARATAMTFMKGLITLREIGEYFGGYNHKTVINAHNAIEDLRDTNKRFRENFRLINEAISL